LLQHVRQIKLLLLMVNVKHAQEVRTQINTNDIVPNYSATLDRELFKRDNYLNVSIVKVELERKTTTLSVELINVT
jgi:hypothetical protein